WLGELLHADPDAAGAFIVSTLEDFALTAQFRDDSLVCALRVADAPAFLAAHKQLLLEDDCRLLARVVHLLRVACKEAPAWLPGPGLPTVLLVPVGRAWAAVAELIVQALDDLLPAQLGLVLGFAEDFVRLVSVTNPEPAGAVAVGRIALGVLRHLDGYGGQALRERAIDVVIKTPQADPAAFVELLERADPGSRDPVAEDMAEALMCGPGTEFAVRAFPNEIADLMRRRLLVDSTEPHDHLGRNPIGVEPYFGVRDRARSEFFPPSAIRGPFVHLLSANPESGMELVLDLVNHGSSWYGERRWHGIGLEPAELVTVRVPADETTDQWANGRLWCMYRNQSVVPGSLATALMALEAWLLERCEADDPHVEEWLLDLLGRSNNVAVSAVVASVCTAHPARCGRAGPALLTSEAFVAMDRARMVGESGGQSVLEDLFPAVNAETWIYRRERKKSNELPHRRHDLEFLAIQLQTTDLREEVWDVLDRHRAALPPEADQTDEHRLWRLSMHRMDLRGFEVVSPEEAADEAHPDTSEGVLVGPGQIEEDILELVEAHAPVRAGFEAAMALVSWGLGNWSSAGGPPPNPGDWSEMLTQAMEERESSETEDFGPRGRGFIAAVCVRDHWDELSSELREWCVRNLISAVRRHADSQADTIRHARGGLDPDRAAAFVLPRLVQEGRAEMIAAEEIEEAIGIALTHAVTEVADHAAAGLSYLAGEGHAFALQCVAALARQGRLMSQRVSEERLKPWAEQVSADELAIEVAAGVRDDLRQGDLDAPADLASLSFEEWPGRVAIRRILMILGASTDADLALTAFSRVTEAL
ncbi:MAG: hypothetical protein ACYS7M_11735, partial [Planctomycetota bacterium]